jgi:hypothetical protein
MSRSDPTVSTAAPFVPESSTLPSLREAAAGCHACPLWKTGTQTVFGEGTGRATVCMIGEQPGHEEDLAGKPFVGPAGRELDVALTGAGIDRRQVYVTNMVKHFKWEPRGKRAAARCGSFQFCILAAHRARRRMISQLSCSLIATPLSLSPSSAQSVIQPESVTTTTRPLPN